mgnify:CR=1 FL=1
MKTNVMFFTDCAGDRRMSINPGSGKHEYNVLMVFADLRIEEFFLRYRWFYHAGVPFAQVPSGKGFKAVSMRGLVDTVWVSQLPEHPLKPQHIVE